MQYEKDELIDVLKEFIGVMKDSGLDYISIKNDKFELELGKKPAPPAMPPIAMPMGGMPMPAAPAAPMTATAESTAPKAEPKSVKSPIVGTFYAAPSPTKPPFVKVGDKINVGDVVCIVESMKVMNEIQADIAGTVAAIAVADGEAVEYGQPLIILE